MSAPTRCEYFERYGDSGHRGLCEEKATLALLVGPVRPMICVCVTHAEVIASRYPELGGVPDRFVSVDALDQYRRLSVPLCNPWLAGDVVRFIPEVAARTSDQRIFRVQGVSPTMGIVTLQTLDGKYVGPAKPNSLTIAQAPA